VDAIHCELLHKRPRASYRSVSVKFFATSCRDRLRKEGADLSNLLPVTLNAGERDARRWRKMPQNGSSTVINSRMKNGSFGTTFYPVPVCSFMVQNRVTVQKRDGLPRARPGSSKSAKVITRMQNVFCCSLTSEPSTVTLLS